MPPISTGPPATRHARLKLRPSTLARLMQWQYQAVAGGHTKPSYSDLIDALVSRASDLTAHDLVEQLVEAG